MPSRSHQSAGKPAGNTSSVGWASAHAVSAAWAKAQPALFFALFYVYLWRIVDVRLIYYAAGMVSDLPEFFRGEAFLRPFLSYPGGLAEYLGAFLAQWFYWPWTGALVVTLQAWLLAACAGRILDAAGASRLRWVRFAFPVGLLVTCSHYACYFVAVAGMSIALVAACLHIAMTARLRDRGRLLAFGVLSIAVYHVAGAAYLLFAALCAACELLRGRWRPGVACLACVLAVPYVLGVLLFRVSAEMAFAVGLPSWTRTGLVPLRDIPMAATWALVAVLPVALVAAGLWRLATHRRHPAEAKETKRRGSAGLLDAARLGYERRPILRWTLASLMLLVVAAAAAAFSYDGVRKATFQVHYYACRRMWPELLVVARRASLSVATINAVDRALYHSGRLGSEMFAWPQRAEALLVSGQDQDMTFWTKFDTAMDLGLVNLAHKNYTECLEIYGPHPLILERLALANLVKGNVDAARIWLGALSKTLFHARWARESLAHLEADPTLAKEARVMQWRSICMKEDSPTIFAPTEWQLQTLLKENGGNRMAFEYLMSTYMLTRQLEKLVGLLDRLDALGYTQFPRHYEEAILVYAYTTRQPVFLHGREIDPQTRQRIEQFSQTFNRYGKDKQAALRELAGGYGDSYFFFNLYGLSGVKR